MVLTAILLAILLSACGTPPLPAAATPIVIGVDVSRDGPDRLLAAEVLASVQSRVEKEMHGQVDGHPLLLRILDDSMGGRPDGEQGAANLRTLAADSRVLGVIGPLQSSLAGAEIAVVSPAHLVLVSPLTTNACLTRPGGPCGDLPVQLRGGGPVSYFRILPAEDGEAEAAALLVSETLRAGPVAVGSDGTAYGVAMADRFAAAVRRLGAGVALRRDLDPRSPAGVQDFLAEGEAAGARSLFFGGREGGGACQVAAARRGPLAGAPFLGGDGLLSSSCPAGAAPSSLFAIGSPADATPAAAADDATSVLVAAISRAIKANGGNLPSREAVRVQMAATRDFGGHWGRFGFDANGDTTLRVYTAWSSGPGGWTPLRSIRVPAA